MASSTDFDIELFKGVLKEVGISDWLEDWDLKNISKEVSKLTSGQVYLEVGVAFGVSASLALLCSQPGVTIRGVDVINWAVRDQNINNILNQYQLSRFPDWEFIEGESEVVGRYWDKGLIDLLFIDGDHTYEGCMRDIALWIPWLKHGGTVMFDDYNDRDGVKKAINEVLRDHRAFTNHRVDGEMYICQKI